MAVRDVIGDLGISKQSQLLAGDAEDAGLAINNILLWTVYL